MTSSAQEYGEKLIVEALKDAKMKDGVIIDRDIHHIMELTKTLCDIVRMEGKADGIDAYKKVHTAKTAV